MTSKIEALIPPTSSRVFVPANDLVDIKVVFKTLPISQLRLTKRAFPAKQAILGFNSMCLDSMALEAALYKPYVSKVLQNGGKQYC